MSWPSSDQDLHEGIGELAAHGRHGDRAHPGDSARLARCGVSPAQCSGVDPDDHGPSRTVRPGRAGGGCVFGSGLGGLAGDQGHQGVGEVGGRVLPGVGLARRVEADIGICLESAEELGPGVGGELGVEPEGPVGIGPVPDVPGVVDGPVTRLLLLGRAGGRPDLGGAFLEALQAVIRGGLQ